MKVSIFIPSDKPTNSAVLPQTHYLRSLWSPFAAVLWSLKGPWSLLSPTLPYHFRQHTVSWSWAVWACCGNLNLSPCAWTNSSSDAGLHGVVYKMPTHLSHETQCRNMGCINKGKKDSSFHMQGQTVLLVIHTFVKYYKLKFTKAFSNELAGFSLPNSEC